MLSRVDSVVRCRGDSSDVAAGDVMRRILISAAGPSNERMEHRFILICYNCKSRYRIEAIASCF